MLRSNEMDEDRKAPDLRALDGQLDFLRYHPADSVARVAHERVDEAVAEFWNKVHGSLPEGPGMTRALHALSRLRMDCNNCIANHGA